MTYTQPDRVRSLPRSLQWCAAALPVVAVLAADPGGRSPFVAAKWLAVSATAWLLVTLARRADPRPTDPTAVSAAVTGLVVWLALSASVGLNPAAAWVGTGERTYGWVTWLLGAALIGTGARLHRIDGGRSLQTGLVVAHLGLVTWCALEVAGVSIIDVDVVTDRVTGPFGSAAVTASALLLIVPVGTVICWNDRHHRSRARRVVAWAGVAAGPIGLAALAATGTRAAWLTVLVVAGAAGWMQRSAVGRVPGRWLVAAIGVAVIAVGIGIAPVADRWGTLTDRASGGGAGRLDEWQAAIGVISDRPLVGTGPEGYLMAVTAHLDDDYAITYGRDVLVDRAHSGPLDVGAIGGLPALVVWLAVLGALCALVRRALCHGDGYARATGLGVGGYLVAQMLLFPVAVLDPILWLLVGWLGAAVPARSPTRWAWHGRRLPAGVYVTAGVALTVWSIAAGVAHVAADRQLQRAISADDPASAVDAARQATRWRPDLTVSWVIRTELERSAGDLAGAHRSVDRGLHWSPLDPVLRLQRGQLLVDSVDRGDTDPDTAVQWLTALAADDPANPAVHLALAAAQAQAGDATASIASFERAATLAPDDPAPLVGAGRVQLAIGDLSGARSSVQRALARRSDDPAAIALQREVAAAS